MPTFRITAPDGATYDVTGPEGATEQDALAQVQAQQAQPKADPLKEAQAQQMSEMGTGQRIAAAAGKAPMDLLRGAQQVAPDLPWMLDPFRLGSKTLNKATQALGMGSVEEARKLEAPLMDTTAGKVGNVAGSIATMLPAAFIPGANTVAGAGLVGAVGGALQPTVEGESRTQNAALGGLTGAGSQYGIGKVAGYLGNKLAGKEASEATRQAMNASKDAAKEEARQAGYVTTPSLAGGSGLGRLIEGAAGKTKAQQQMAVKNQELTDSLVRKAFSLPDDAPISHDTMRQVRSAAAASGYEPVRAVPAMKTDDVFRDQIKALTSRADNASKDFGELVVSDVKPLVDNLTKVKSFSGDSAVDQVSILRELASDSYAKGNKTLGKAYRGAAEAIEGQIERGLAKSGKDGAKLIKDYRAARTTMAQTFDAEKGIREGAGVLDAKALGRIFDKSPNRLTGELRTIGRAASAMPEVMGVPKTGWANPITAVDSNASVYASLLTGTPLPMMVPGARVAGGKLLMSDLGQKMFASPKYGPGKLEKLSPKALKLLEQYGAGGLLGSAYAGQ